MRQIGEIVHKRVELKEFVADVGKNGEPQWKVKCQFPSVKPEYASYYWIERHSDAPPVGPMLVDAEFYCAGQRKNTDGSADFHYRWRIQSAQPASGEPPKETPNLPRQPMPEGTGRPQSNASPVNPITTIDPEFKYQYGRARSGAYEIVAAMIQAGWIEPDVAVCDAMPRITEITDVVTLALYNGEVAQIDNMVSPPQVAQDDEGFVTSGEPDYEEF